MFGLFESGVAGVSVGFDESGLTGGMGGVGGSLWAVAAAFDFGFCFDGASGGGPNGLMASGMWMFAVPPGAAFAGALRFGGVESTSGDRGWKVWGSAGPPNPPSRAASSGAQGGAGAMKR